VHDTGASKNLDAGPQAGGRPATDFLIILVGLTFLMNAVGRGVTESFAVFLLPVEADLEASRSEIAATYSIYMIVHGLAAPFAGQLIDRLGTSLDVQGIVGYASHPDILERAGAANADLIIAGGYGHSRLREWVLGGE